ncbi:uncharacterized protein L203_103656 [Cryptococcus depauperatus CBS 7841]|uniref:Rab-GAP TBC domain-containing protein n=1 Tax=Cryptococcus depauperatus CBS 7841 TaxID=1295531 RepID=A0AAJ8JU00_9TREE
MANGEEENDRLHSFQSLLDSTKWREAARAHRHRYYSLVQTFMEELESQTDSVVKSAIDRLLIGISKEVQSLKSPFWHRSVIYRRSSPFYSKSEKLDSEEKFHSTRLEEDDCSDSEDEATTSPLISRRAIFRRLQELSALECLQKENLQTTDDQSSMSPLNSSITSPKIILSTESDPTFPESHARKLTSLDMSVSQPPSVEIANRHVSPITLFAPRALSSIANPSISLPSTLLHPDDHRECLIRLLYIFCRSNPQWPYRSSFVDIARVLYLTYAGGGKLDLDYAEEQTFWALSAFIGDIDGLMAEGGIKEALVKFERRLHWVNAPLWAMLQNRGLDSELYAHRWLASIYIRDLPLHRIPRLFDYIISQGPSTPEYQPKIDLIIDIGVALVSLLKTQLSSLHRRVGGQGLWSDVIEEEVENKEEALARNLHLLHAYPLKQVGDIKTVLCEAEELRELRTMAVQNGSNPDILALPVKQATSVSKSQKQTTSTVSNWRKAVGSLWSSWASPVASSPHEESKGVPSTPLKSLKSQPDHSPVALRNRSDSVASSASTIQERLVSFSKHFSPSASPVNHTEEAVNLPRPLLLSSSARPTGRTSSRRESISSSPPRPSLPLNDPLVGSANEFRLMSGPFNSPGRASRGLYQFRNRNKPSFGASSTPSQELERNSEGEMEKALGEGNE